MQGEQRRELVLLQFGEKTFSSLVNELIESSG